MSDFRLSYWMFTTYFLFIYISLVLTKTSVKLHKLTLKFRLPTQLMHNFLFGILRVIFQDSFLICNFKNVTEYVCQFVTINSEHSRLYSLMLINNPNIQYGLVTFYWMYIQRSHLFDFNNLYLNSHCTIFLKNSVELFLSCSLPRVKLVFKHFVTEFTSVVINAN